jgi:hypothetical protein
LRRKPLAEANNHPRLLGTDTNNQPKALRADIPL